MKKKALSLLLALAMLCTLMVPAMAEETAALGDFTGKLVILHNNDVHGRTNDNAGYAGIAARAAEYIAAGAEVILLDAGDTLHGTPVANLSRGENIVKLLNMVGYSALVPGNHDFNYGYERTLELGEALDFPILAANVTYKDSGELVFGDRIILEAGGYTVGIFGLATVETVTKTDPKNVEPLHFAEGEEMYAVAQAQVDALTAEGVDLIICLGHLGVDESSAPNRSTDVIEATKGIDLFIDGHSHTEFPEGKAVGDTLLASTGEYLKNIGEVVFDGESLTASLTAAADYAVRDEEIAAAAKADKDAVTEEYGTRIVAVSEVTLDGNRAPGVRTQETNLGNLVADGMMYGAQKAGFAPVAAVVNGGGIRITKEAGSVSMLDVYNIIPFGNNLTILALPGTILDKALEDNVGGLPSAEGGFPQTSGMIYTIDLGQPAGDRVTIETIGGLPFDAEETYEIVTLDFLGRGGDKYAEFKPYFDNVGFGVLDQAVTEYITEELGGVISAAQYGGPEGRITVIPADVDGWYADYAAAMIRARVMGTTGEGNFDGGASVTRATVFQTLYNMAGKPAVESAATFSDVADGAWYADSAAWAEQVGLAAGTGTGSYDGDRVITRQEIATVLDRYLAERNVWPAIGALTAYADAADVASWATGGVTNMVALGVISGTGAGLLNPEGTATRAELAAMLARYIDLAPKYTETVIEIENGDHVIPGILTVPGGEGTFPAVVMLHGTGSNKNEAGGGYDLAAPALAEAGIASLRIDFMGNGDSTADYIDYNFTTAVSDADAAAAYLAGLENVNGDAIGVMGWSQGGTIALLAAGQSDVYQAVVTWAGAPDLSSLTSDSLYATARAEGYTVLEFDWRDSLKQGYQWHKDVAETDVLEVFGASEAAVLAIAGANDDVVDPAWADKIVAAAANAASDTYVIDACDHTFNIFTGDLTAIEDAIGATAGFFAAQLGVKVTGTAAVVDKYGNVTTDILAARLTAAGFVPGDLLTVTVGGTVLEVPYGTNYSDVDTGNLIARNAGDARGLILAINMGNFGTTYGVEVGDAVVITMAEQGGYYAGFMAHQVKRTNERSDYASDEVFANFRAVTTTGMGEGVLYRSSSPINNEIGRAAYSDALIAKAGVATAINLADSAEEIAGYAAAEDFNSPYYMGLYEAGSVITLSMGVDFRAEAFQTKLAEGLKFMAANPGPYLVHCTEGKDRAGFVSALLEMLMGATAEEIKADYLTSFVNYYNVEGFDVVEGTEKYDVIGEGNILESVRMIAGLTKGADLEGVDLVAAAVDYLLGIGLTEGEIAAIQTNLK